MLPAAGIRIKQTATAPAKRTRLIYRAYNLNLETWFPLTQLPPGSGRADVRIQLGDIVEKVPLTQTHLCVRASPQQVILAVPGLGRFSIQDGSQIIFSPDVDVDVKLVELFLTDYALGYLLLQREQMVFQASALSLFGQGLLISGPSNSGKSSLALGLWQRGHRFFGEDLAAVMLCAGRTTLLPGIPRMKIWEDRISQLNLNTNDYHQIRPDQARHLIPSGDLTCPEQVPLKHLIYLMDWGGDQVRAVPMRGFEKIHWLQKSCFGSPETLAAMGLSARHFRLLTTIAEGLPVTKLCFPRGEEHFDRIQNEIEGICRP